MQSSTNTHPMRRCKDDPVIGIRVLPDGPRYLFDALSSGDAPRQFFRLGASKECEIRIDDRYVSKTHCLIQWDRHRAAVHVYDLSKNGTRINGMLTPMSELIGGSVLTVGATHLQALTHQAADERPVFAASNLRDFVATALEFYGQVRPTAAALGIARSTLRDWRKRWKLEPGIK